MGYEEKLKEIDALQQQIAAHGKLSDEVRKKIDYKFRLDWNYYSNSMEGNTLTMEETRSVMIGNVTVDGKPLKDVLEIRGHDTVIGEILKMGRGDARLAEKRIKDIHRGIMHEDDLAKRLSIGEWKTVANHVLNYKGERYDFAEPRDVPERIHDLLNRTNAAIDANQGGKKGAFHPIDVALNFHLEYLEIHPFYDGNGRTARILTNLLLIAQGYPPFWIRVEERPTYYRYLADIQCYGGKPDLFKIFATDLILRSQRLVLDAIAGKEIEELGDWKKKTAQLKQNLSVSPKVVELNAEVNKRVMQEVYLPFLRLCERELTVFDSLFEHASWHRREDRDRSNILSILEDGPGKAQPFERVLEQVSGSYKGEMGGYFEYPEVFRVYQQFNGDSDGFNMTIAVSVKFVQYEFELQLFVGNPDEYGKSAKLMRHVASQVEGYNKEKNYAEGVLATVNYGKTVTENEIADWVNIIGDTAYRYMEFAKEQLEKKRIERKKKK